MEKKVIISLSEYEDMRQELNALKANIKDSKPLAIHIGSGMLSKSYLFYNPIDKDYEEAIKEATDLIERLQIQNNNLEIKLREKSKRKFWPWQ